MPQVKFGLIGAGGFGREVMPYVRASIGCTLGIKASDIDLFFVETWEPDKIEINGYPVISLEKFLSMDGSRFFNVAIGNGGTRQTIAQQVGSMAQAIHIHAPQTIFLEKNSIGEGAVFCSHSMVTSNTTIGHFFQANIYSYVAHDCVIGNFVTFAPGVKCNGRVHIGDYAYVGTNAVIREGTQDRPLRIGIGAVIGMGSVVTKDVPDGVTVIGNPARPMAK